MLDLARYERIQLHPRPPTQRLIASLYLAPLYHLWPRVDIRCEHIERLPDTPVIYAMNHTDAYNYWPLQYWLHRHRRRYLANWVKGKNYEGRFVGWFMEHTNNIPVVSRGYLITRDFISATGRRPAEAEYRALRALIENPTPPDALPDVPAALFYGARDILGYRFDPSRETYTAAMRTLYRKMMAHFVRLNEAALALGLDILVFPQGTRSVRLSRGHIGLAQMALHLRAPIVPVGCNNSDQVYPTMSPLPRQGAITYRLGEPLRYDDDLAPFHVPGEFAPFDPDDERTHRDRFQGLVDLVMDRINGLVEERHQYTRDRASGGTQGTDRFV